MVNPGHMTGVRDQELCPRLPAWPSPGWPLQQPCSLWSEGHAAAHWDSAESPILLSGALKFPGMMFWGLLSLLLFAVASGTPIGDQDEDIQVQENFEPERVKWLGGPWNLGAEGMGEVLFHFPPKRKMISHNGLCGAGLP